MEQRQVRGPVVELSGNRRAVVDGCDGILDYGEEQVSFRAGRLTLCLSGRDLRLVKLTESAAVVEGFIQRRSEERRVGKECASKCRSRWSPYH